MINLAVKIRQKKPLSVKKREWSKMVHRSLRQMGLYWITHFRKLHFLPSAVQRYAYSARSSRTLRIKQLQQSSGKVKVPGTGVGKGKMKDAQWMSAPSSPGPLVWTGNARREILGRSPESFNIKTSYKEPKAATFDQTAPSMTKDATPGKLQVKVPVKVPHPMQPKNLGEFSRLNQVERAEMSRVGFDWLQTEIALVQGEDVWDIG